MDSSPASQLRLPQSRTEALAWYARLKRQGDDTGRWETTVVNGIVRPGIKAWLGRRDLYFLVVFLLKRAGDLCPAPIGKRDIKGADWLFARAREVQAQPNGMIDLWAREHYKSTFITLGLSIQDIIRDPEVTIGIFADVNKTAKPFLLQIKREFESNEDLKATYPDVLYADPATQSPKWTQDEGIIVKRQGNPKECTVEAYGLIDGQPTGRHFKILVFDDLVSENTVGSEEMMAKVRTRWELADSLGSNLPGYEAPKRIAGTRYHIFDVYRTILDRKSAVERLHPATANGQEDGEPVLMTHALLRKKRRDQGPYTFGAQMLLNPTADKTQGFDETWLKYWPRQHFDNLNLYMIVDPSGGKKGKGKRKLGDYTAIWVIGVGADGNYYVCDFLRDRLNLTGRCRAVMALHRKWRPLTVGYEEYGMQADREALEWLMNHHNYRFTTVALGGALAKTERIKRLVPVAEQGRLYMPQGGIIRNNSAGVAEDVIRLFIDEEWSAFPLALHDDGLDSLARILDPEMGVSTEIVPNELGEGIAKDAYGDEGDPDTTWMAG